MASADFGCSLYDRPTGRTSTRLKFVLIGAVIEVILTCANYLALRKPAVDLQLVVRCSLSGRWLLPVGYFLSCVFLVIVP